MEPSTNFAVVISLIFPLNFHWVISLLPMTKEEHVARINKMNDAMEPFEKNLTECATITKASMTDIENFLKRLPQTTTQGKCFVACILKRINIIEKNKLSAENLIEANRAVFGDNSDSVVILREAIGECIKIVEDMFEICEYASVFNDCMHIRMEHIMNELMISKKMNALGRMDSNTDDSEEDDQLKLTKEEL